MLDVLLVIVFVTCWKLWKQKKNKIRNEIEENVLPVMVLGRFLFRSDKATGLVFSEGALPAVEVDMELEIFERDGFVKASNSGSFSAQCSSGTLRSSLMIARGADGFVSVSSNHSNEPPWIGVPSSKSKLHSSVFSFRSFESCWSSSELTSSWSTSPNRFLQIPFVGRIERLSNDGVVEWFMFLIDIASMFVYKILKF